MWTWPAERRQYASAKIEAAAAMLVGWINSNGRKEEEGLLVEQLMILPSIFLIYGKRSWTGESTPLQVGSSWVSNSHHPRVFRHDTQERCGSQEFIKANVEARECQNRHGGKAV